MSKITVLFETNTEKAKKKDFVQMKPAWTSDQWLTKRQSDEVQCDMLQ